MTSLLNFIKIYQLVQKLLVGHTQTDRQTGDLIILTFLFEESRLITILLAPIQNADLLKIYLKVVWNTQ
jgi:hypothetical protein